MLDQLEHHALAGGGIEDHSLQIGFLVVGVNRATELLDAQGLEPRNRLFQVPHPQPHRADALAVLLHVGGDAQIVVARGLDDVQAHVGDGVAELLVRSLHRLEPASPEDLGEELGGGLQVFLEQVEVVDPVAQDVGQGVLAQGRLHPGHLLDPIQTGDVCGRHKAELHQLDRHPVGRLGFEAARLDVHLWLLGVGATSLEDHAPGFEVGDPRFDVGHLEADGADARALLFQQIHDADGVSARGLDDFHPVVGEGADHLQPGLLDQEPARAEEL